jgi:alkanesulfonate monooxygenase SsuD/methylene tetrahydromethanopterin reductase-like flavin-dependent oxidoreductase (luciferase family)
LGHATAGSSSCRGIDGPRLAAAGRQPRSWASTTPGPNDHIGWRDLVDGPWFDAVPTRTAAATVTSRIHPGTHVASANFRHPAAFAREVMALDDTPNGRFLLGIGAGGKGFDSTVLGQPELSGRERVARFTEFVSLLRQILGNDRTTYDGRYFSDWPFRRASRPSTTGSAACKSTPRLSRNT